MEVEPDFSRPSLTLREFDVVNCLGMSSRPIPVALSFKCFLQVKEALEKSFSPVYEKVNQVPCSL